MKHLLSIISLFFILIFPNVCIAQTPPIIVGRVTHINGELLRYIPEDNDWTAAVKDVPVGVDDILYSSDQSRSEIIFPNGTLLRIGDDTQIQMDTLRSDLSELDIASGVARIYAGRGGLRVKAISQFGYVLAEPNTIFDFYVGENSVEVVPVRGTITFVHTASNTRYDISEGSSSILADRDQVSSGEETVDADWNNWNLDRDSFWANRRSSRSTRYLPPVLWDDAYTLDEYGSWETVYYNGASRWFWRPRVALGWGPFTVGRWAHWHNDHTWIPNEPFGYLTHHYGNWILARNRWYWAPPVVSVSARLPLLDIGFFWWPGRVSWIHSQGYVGWVPLAPYEPYYSRRSWGGPRTVVVNNVTINQINININNLAYRNHSIIVPRDDLYTTDNYRSVRVERRAADIGRYRAAPVIDRALPGYTNIPQRFNFTNRRLSEKPHNTVVERLRQNRTAVRQAESGRQVLSQSQARSIPEGRISRQVRIPEPVTRNYLVPAGRVNAPATELQPRTTTVKKRPEALTPEKRPSITTPSSQVQTTSPPAKTGPTAPQKPQTIQPGPTRPATPAKPGIPSPREQRGLPRPGEAPVAKPSPATPPASGITPPAPEKRTPPPSGPQAPGKPAPMPPSAKPSETPSKITPEATPPAGPAERRGVPSAKPSPAERRPAPPERPSALEKPTSPSEKPSEQVERRSIPSPKQRTLTPVEKPAAPPDEKPTSPRAKPAAPAERQSAPPERPSVIEKPAAPPTPAKPSAPRARPAEPAEKPTPPPAKPAAPPEKPSAPPERPATIEKPAAPPAPAKPSAPPEKPAEAEKPAPSKKPSEQDKGYNPPEKPRVPPGRRERDTEDEEDQVR